MEIKVDTAMIYKEITKKYTEAGHNVSNTRQVVMLYDGIIKFLRNAQISFEQKEFENVYSNVQKAKNIIQGLQLGINFDKGGNIAQTLNDFYDGMFFRLSLFNIRDGSQGSDYLSKITRDLQTMRNAWAEIDAQTMLKNTEEKKDADENPNSSSGLA
jgi:flagellar protein FliS